MPPQPAATVRAPPPGQAPLVQAQLPSAAPQVAIPPTSVPQATIQRAPALQPVIQPLPVPAPGPQAMLPPAPASQPVIRPVLAPAPVIQPVSGPPSVIQQPVQPPTLLQQPLRAHLQPAVEGAPNQDPHPIASIYQVQQQPAARQGEQQPNQPEVGEEQAQPFPPLPPPLLVTPEQLDRFGYLKNHHSTWTPSNLLTEKDSLLQKIKRFSTSHESQNYKALLAELARLYLDLIGYMNALNSSSESDVLDSARRVIRESEARIDEIRAVIKNSMLILNRGNDFRQILPGPSSCDYNAEDKSRIRESEQFIRSKDESRKQRGQRRGKRGAYNPYGGRGNYRYSQPVGNAPGPNRPSGFGPGPQGGAPPGAGNPGSNVICFYCGQKGHVRMKCLKRLFDGVP